MKDIAKYFEEIEDRRQQWKVKYNLVEVIVMTIIAVTAGAEHWTEIAMYCKKKIDILRSEYGLKLENGIPSEDTFMYIFAIIIPEQLEKCFINWVKTVYEIPGGEIISMDGKTLRGSRDDSNHVIHMISAWAGKTGIVLGQLRVDEKSNEIPAVPKLLDLIDAEGCIFTSDAMSCQKKTVEKIVKKKCDYVICLKGNQETLHDDVKLYFEAALKEPTLYAFEASKPITEKGHGRIETRQYFISKEINDFVDQNEWKSLSAVGMVISKRIEGGKESIENRYFISSVTDLKLFSIAVRKHWGIENSLHWCLDTNFDEDHCRSRVDNSGENLAVLRHIALNLYKSFKSGKMSIKSKRFRCSFDDDFLHSVILNKFL